MGLNIVGDYNLLQNDIIKLKKESNLLLFIGQNWNEAYIDAACKLIDSFESILKEKPDLELHLIGMNSEMFKNKSKNIFFYGYLDKDDEIQRNVYYDLIKRAKVFINTSGSFGATSEAMYFFTPVVTSLIPEFTSHYGYELSFGKYCESINTISLKKCIIDIIESSNYNSLCINAHNQVAAFTWDKYVTKMMKIIEN
jgi:glycosyltransferase involved in cell wall biosynthesis